MNTSEKLKEILAIFMKSRENTQEALRQLGLTTNLIELYSSILPNFDKLLPEEVEKIQKDIKELAILYYSNRNFSQREIARRLGGNSFSVVNKIIEKHNGKAREEVDEK